MASLREQLKLSVISLQVCLNGRKITMDSR